MADLFGEPSIVTSEDVTIYGIEDQPYTLRLADFPYNDSQGYTVTSITYQALSYFNLLFDPDGLAGPLAPTRQAGLSEQLLAVDIAAGRWIAYFPANLAGPSAVTMLFSVSTVIPDLPVQFGGTSAAYTLTFALAEVNDPPFGADRAFPAGGITMEGATFVYKLADFAFTDPVEHNGFAGLVLDGLPAAGTLAVNGVAATIGQFVDTATIVAGGLTYHAADEVGTPGLVQFSYFVRDDGGTDNGGADTSGRANKTVTFVRGFNDAPILTAPAIVSGTTGEVINLSGANAFSIADADIGSQPLRIDLSVASGSLSINLAGAAALVTPNGGSNLGIVGTLGDINATLATLVYTAGSQAGSSAITVRVDDHAAIGGGGNLLANGDAELSVGAFAGGWSGSSIRASDYGIGFGRFGDLDNADALAIGGGSKFFYATGTTSQSAVQTIDVSLYAAAIDAGSIAADVSGYLGGKGAEDDSMSMTAHFVSGQGVELGSATIGPVTAADRSGISQLLFRSAASAVPAGTRSIQVEMHSYVASGTSDAYADNLALYLNNVVSTVIPVELVPANVAPVGLDDTTAADEDQTIAGNLLANDSDGNGDTLRVSNISGVAGSAVVTQGSSAVLKGMWGTLAVNADGSYSYSADADDTDVQPAGTPLYDTFTYTVSDGNGGADTATLTVTVTPLSDIAVQTGTNKADVLNGDWARAGIDDTIHGGSGNDQIDGKAGADFLYGGVGDDQIWGGEGIDRLFGEAGNDMLSGGLGNDRLYGDVGDDRLYGDAGDDILVGGQGNDWLAGGAGADTYVFLSGKSKAAEQDRILGFDLADDQLNLQGVTITGVSQSAGSTVLALSSGAFVTLDGISVANWMAYGADNVTYDLIV